MLSLEVQGGSLWSTIQAVCLHRPQAAAVHSPCFSKGNATISHSSQLSTSSTLHAIQGRGPCSWCRCSLLEHNDAKVLRFRADQHVRGPSDRKLTHLRKANRSPPFIQGYTIPVSFCLVESFQTRASGRMMFWLLGRAAESRASSCNAFSAASLSLTPCSQGSVRHAAILSNNVMQQRHCLSGFKAQQVLASTTRVHAKVQLPWTDPKHGLHITPLPRCLHMNHAMQSTSFDNND